MGTNAIIVDTVNDHPFIEVMDAETGIVVPSTLEMPGRVYRIRISGDHKYIGVCHIFGAGVSFIERSTLNILTPAEVWGERGTDVTFSPDNSKAAVGRTWSPGFTIYSLPDMTETQPFGNISRQIASLDWSPDGSMIATTASWGETLVVYDAINFTEMNISHGLSGKGVFTRFSPDGQLLAFCWNRSPGFTLFRTSDWSQITTTGISGNDGYAIAWSDDGSLMAAATNYSQRVWVLETTNWTEVVSLDIGYEVPKGLVITPDNQYIIITTGGWFGLHIFRLADGTPVEDIPDPGEEPYHAAWVPDILKNISGQITDSNDDPAEREFILMSRNTNKVLFEGSSEPVTGMYNAKIVGSGELMRIVKANDEAERLAKNDPVGTVYPDLIDRIIVE